MRISQEINRIGGDLVHNQIAVALFAAVAVLAVVLMQRGVRTYIENTIDRRHARRRIPEARIRALMRHADEHLWWKRWERQIEAWQRLLYEPPDDPAP